jgi:uncharacterized repeat protein (TIGR03803 family)
MNVFRTLQAVVAALFCLAATLSSRAQTYELVSSFSDVASTPNEVLIKASDGNYYGTFANGSASEGGIVRVTAAGEITVLYSFHSGGSGVGYYPRAGLVQAPDGFLYGVTNDGGSGESGKLFRISLSGEFEKIGDFTHSTGYNVQAALTVGPDGNLYGVAQSGGTNNRGTIFRATTSGAVSAVFSFPATGPAISIIPLVLGLDGKLYGIATNGGGFFSYSPSAGYNLVHTFPNAEGNGFFGHMVRGPDGNFYGVAAGGGANGRGTVFKITTAGVVTVLHNFNGTNGSEPYTGLCFASDGFLYGVTREGGASGNGTIFRLPPSGPATVLKSFTATEGTDARSGIVETPLGLMFGIHTSSTIRTPLYRLATNGALTEIGRFDVSNGVAPKSELVQDASGNFYGTTEAAGGGTVFKMAPNGQRTLLHRFVTASGTSPTGPLAFGSDGNLYGVASRDGSTGNGGIFRITPAGVYTQIYGFTAFPNAQGGLVLGNDGNFYGTTSQGGSGGGGQFYRITPAGAFTSLWNFVSATGANPQATLLKEPSGNFLGTTYSGGTNGNGVIFRITPTGTITTLHSYSGTTGHMPFAGLRRGGDGTVYGATFYGGTSDDGVAYKFTAAGAYSVVTNFFALNATDALSPPLPLPDGRLFGTTSGSRLSGYGTIYTVSANGTASVLRTFTEKDGAAPCASFLAASDGNLYGSTSYGGLGGGGTIFRLRFGATPKTLVATDSTTTGATLQASVNPNGAATNVVFEWGASPDALVNTTAPASAGSGSSLVTVSIPLAGLAPMKTYYYRVRADNAQQLAPQRGEVLSFSTAVATAPIVTTLAANPVGVTSATLRGSVTARGMTTSLYFERADQPTEAQWIVGLPPSVDGTAVGQPFTAELSGLLAHTTYSVRAVARDSATAFGSPIAFTTANTPPVAGEDNYHLTAPEVTFEPLVNDTDADGDTLIIIAVTQGNSGVVTFDGTTLRYKAGPNFSGKDQFHYTVSDGYGGTSAALVSVSNTGPQAADLTLHANFGPGGGTTVDISAQVSDADGDPLVIVATGPATHGTLTFSGRQLTYANADASFAGSDTFTYTVSDGFGETATARITFTNIAPVAQADSFMQDAVGSPLNVLANDTDADGDSLTIVSTGAAAFGTVTTNGVTVTYVPAAEFEGVDEFDYTITDGRGATSTARVVLKADYPVVRLLAAKGGPVPGLDGATWVGFGAPSIFAQGTRAGWLARVRGPNGVFPAIVSGPLGAPEIRVRRFASAPDGVGASREDVRFASFSDPVFAGEDYAFVAKVDDAASGRRTGLWVSSAGKLRALAEQGDLAPGTLSLEFGLFTQVAMPKPGVVFFSANVRASGIVDTLGSTRGLWAWTQEAGTRLVIQEDQVLQVEGKLVSVASIDALGTVPGSPGHARYDSSTGAIDLRLRFHDGSEALATVSPDAVITMTQATFMNLASGDAAASFGLPSSPGGGAGQVAALTLDNEEGTQAIYDFGGGGIMARTGEEADGADGARFQRFLSPVSGRVGGGDVGMAFGGVLSGETGASRLGIWTCDAGNTKGATGAETARSRLVVRGNASTPGIPGGVFHAFSSLTVMDGRGPALVARYMLRTPGGPARIGRGVWATDANGTLHAIFHQGDSIAGRTLRNFRFLEAVPGSVGQRRAWAEGDDTPSLIFRAVFKDGSEGVVAVAVP